MRKNNVKKNKKKITDIICTQKSNETYLWRSPTFCSLALTALSLSLSLDFFSFRGSQSSHKVKFQASVLCRTLKRRVRRAESKTTTNKEKIQKKSYLKIIQ